MRLPRHSEELKAKFRTFVKTFGTSANQAGGSFLCPCAQCQCMTRWSDVFQIHRHLVSKVFADCYINEFEGQETSSSDEGRVNPSAKPDLNPAILQPEDEQPTADDVAEPPYFGEDDEEDKSDVPAATNTLIRNIISASIHVERQDDEKPNRDGEIFLKLLEEAKNELYPGCKEATKVSFIVQFFQIKCMYGISNACLEAILKLFSRVLPEGHCIPDSLDVTP